MRAPDPDRFLQARVPESGTLKDAMWALEKSRAEIALVVDGGDRLLGTLTDGDIRRALLKGASLDANVLPHMTRNFTAVTPETSRAEVLDFMQARTFGQIPIVNQDGVVIGLHLLSEILGGVDRPNAAFILAGGRGTRLLPLTETVPKPMISVAGRPILERLVLHLVGHGIRSIYLSINYLGGMVEEHFQDGARFGCRIEYVREAEPLDTGGPLSLLSALPRDPLLVVNGDLVTQADFGAMLDAHVAGGQSITVAINPYFHTVPYGCVEIADARVTAILEKPTITRWVNAGMYILDPAEIARLPKGRAFSMPWAIEQALQDGRFVAAYEVEGEWIDVGQREQLRIARGGRDG